MTRRSTFTAADLARAVRVADELGKVALWTAAGIVFVPRETVIPSPPPGDPFDLVDMSK